MNRRNFLTACAAGAVAGPMASLAPATSTTCWIDQWIDEDDIDAEAFKQDWPDADEPIPPRPAGEGWRLGTGQNFTAVGPLDQLRFIADGPPRKMWLRDCGAVMFISLPRNALRTSQ